MSDAEHDESGVAGLSPDAPRRSRAISDATRRMYASDLRTFRAWLAQHAPEAGPWPPGPVVAAFLTHWFVVQGRTQNTINRLASGVAYAYREAGAHGNMRRDPAVEKALENIALSDPFPAAPQTLGVSVEQLRAITPPATSSRLTDIRDRAILLLTFASGLRVHQLHLLDTTSIHAHPAGVLIEAVPLRQADPHGRPVLVAVRPADTHLDLCPLAALTSWESRLEGDTGPLFRPVSVEHRPAIRRRRLSVAAIRALAPKRARAAGLDSQQPISMYALTRTRAQSNNDLHARIARATRTSALHAGRALGAQDPFDAEARLL